MTAYPWAMWSSRGYMRALEVFGFDKSAAYRPATIMAGQAMNLRRAAAPARALAARAVGTPGINPQALLGAASAGPQSWRQAGQYAAESSLLGNLAKSRQGASGGLSLLQQTGGTPQRQAEALRRRALAAKPMTAESMLEAAGRAKLPPRAMGPGAPAASWSSATGQGLMRTTDPTHQAALAAALAKMRQ